MKNPYMFTYTLRKVNPLDVQEEDIDIIDIAHALSLINRFNGTVRFPISVAQHSIYAARLVSERSNMPLRGNLLALQALLHDAAEAYLGDVTKWLKASDVMVGYRQAEHTLQERIFLRFNCPTVLHPRVEEADRLLVRYEGEQGYGRNWSIDHPDYPP
jgi:5'-deoxynucleotidase YfbR-like HD superfamily hydrolase